MSVSNPAPKSTHEPSLYTLLTSKTNQSSYPKDYVLSLSNLQLHSASFKNNKTTSLRETKIAREALLNAVKISTSLENTTIDLVVPSTISDPNHFEVQSIKPTPAPKICSVCGDLSLENWTVDEARSHYRSDTHRLNAKRRALGQTPLSQEDAALKLLEMEKKLEKSNKKVDSDDDLGSISASASSDSEVSEEEEMEEEDSMKRVGESARLALRIPEDSHEIQVQFYKTLASSKEDLTNLLTSTTHSMIVCLYSAGHFAMALFQDGVIKKSVTEHKYVIRKKQGGAQSSHDSSGKRPKSAGSTLRRHGEMAMRQAVETALREWSSVKVDFIYLGVSTRARSLFVTKTKNDAFDGRWLKNDERLKRVPMATRRPTLSECQRVYTELTSFAFLLLPVEQKLDRDSSSTSGGVPSTLGHSSSGLNGIPSTQDPSASSGIPSTHAKSPQEPHSSTAKPSKKTEQVPHLPISPLVLAIHDATKDDNLQLLQSLWLQMANPDDLRDPETGETPLHVSARNGSLNCLNFLLRQNLNPCLGDFRGRLPYSASKDKTIRVAFRNFRGEFPTQWDWTKTHIPEPPVMETEEQRLVRLAKEKEKKIAKKERKKEQVEAETLAKIEAEKEAEIRKLKDFANTHCLECAKPLSGNKNDVFQRGEAKFCSSVCMRGNTRKLMAQAAEQRAVANKVG